MSRSRMQSPRALQQRNLLGEQEGTLPASRRSRSPRTRRLPAGADVQDGFTAALKLVVEYGRLAKESMEGSAKARCPRCGRLGPVGRHSGARSGGSPRNPESLCLKCREAEARSPGVEATEGELFSLP